MKYLKSFGEVEGCKQLIVDDDFGRIEIAANVENFAKEFKVKLGDKITTSKQ